VLAKLGELVKAQLAAGDKREKRIRQRVAVYTLCRRGVFSAEAAMLLTKAIKAAETAEKKTASPADPSAAQSVAWMPVGVDVSVRSVAGGLEAWKRQVDPTWPVY
jgi:rhodanese-related sulfurtransferase